MSERQIASFEAHALVGYSVTYQTRLYGNLFIVFCLVLHIAVPLFLCFTFKNYEEVLECFFRRNSSVYYFSPRMDENETPEIVMEITGQIVGHSRSEPSDVENSI